MNRKLVDILDLLKILGYTDLRSVRRWCCTNKIPLFRVGKKTYTVSNFLDLHLGNKLKLYVSANYSNPEEVMGAVMRDDNDNLNKLIDTEINGINNKIKTGSNEVRSKAAQKFLKNTE